jgi:hypothetical protein
MKQISLIKKHLLSINASVLKGFFLFLTIGIIVFSCNQNKKEEKAALTADETQATCKPKKWPWFVLTKDMINSNPGLKYDLAIHGFTNAKVILELRFNGISSGLVNHELLGFVATDHTQHGKDRDFFLFKDTALAKPINNLILGNNYLNWNTIGHAIYFTVGTQEGQFKPDFGFILLEPMGKKITVGPRDVPCPKCDDHLWYKLHFFKPDGTEYTPAGGGGTDGSNPSPPADPNP